MGFLLFTIILLITTGCTQLDELPPASIVDRPDTELFGATLRFSRVGEPRFTVEAGRMASVDEERTMYLDQKIRVDFFNSAGNHSAILTAEEGEVLEAEDKLIARGNVVVASDSGMVLMTEELYYNPKQDRVLADGFVTVISDEDSLTGYGFSAASDLNDWLIKNTSGSTWRQPDE